MRLEQVKTDFQLLQKRLELEEFISFGEYETLPGKMVKTAIVNYRDELPDPVWIEVVRWLAEGAEIALSVFFTNGKFKRSNFWNVFRDFRRIADWVKKGWDLFTSKREENEQ